MIAIVTCALLVALLLLVARWMAAAPLLRPLSASIDGRADAVQGEGSEAA